MKRGDKTYLALYRTRKYDSKLWDAAVKRKQVQIYQRLKKGDKNLFRATSVLKGSQFMVLVGI
jgi:hypothetical protein